MTTEKNYFFNLKFKFIHRKLKQFIFKMHKVLTHLACIQSLETNSIWGCMSLVFLHGTLSWHTDRNWANILYLQIQKFALFSEIFYGKKTVNWLISSGQNFIKNGFCIGSAD